MSPKSGKSGKDDKGRAGKDRAGSDRAGRTRSKAKPGADETAARDAVAAIPTRPAPGPPPGQGASGLRRVVITGAGTVNALGLDVASTLAAFRDGRSGITQLDFRDVERLTIQIGAQVHDWNPETYFNRQQILLYDKFTQFTLLAAKEAVAQSGLSFHGELGLCSGCLLYTSDAADE